MRVTGAPSRRRPGTLVHKASGRAPYLDRLECGSASPRSCQSPRCAFRRCDRPRRSPQRVGSVAMGQAALARLPASSGHLRTPAYKMSMKTFFFLNHRHVSTHAEEDRGIGIFSTREIALNAIDSLKSAAGRLRISRIGVARVGRTGRARRFPYLRAGPRRTQVERWISGCERG